MGRSDPDAPRRDSNRMIGQTTGQPAVLIQPVLGRKDRAVSEPGQMTHAVEALMPPPCDEHGGPRIHEVRVILNALDGIRLVVVTVQTATGEYLAPR
jgi:hypothetical protein